MIKCKRNIKVENNNCRELLKELVDFVYEITYARDFAFMPENAEYYVEDVMNRVYKELGVENWKEEQK